MTIHDLVASPVFGSLIGVFGIGIAVLFYVRGRAVRRLAFQGSGVRLIGGIKAALPADVEVLFRKTVVPRLTKTTIVLWNAGNRTLLGSDIVPADPLCICLAIDAKVLDVEVNRITRKVNGCQASASSTSPREILLTFDFLDPRDGMRVDVLHTSESVLAAVAGTVRGMPAGCQFQGMIPPSFPGRAQQSDTRLRFADFSRSLRLLVLSTPSLSLLGVAGLLMLFAGLFPSVALTVLPSLGRGNPMITPGRFNAAFVSFGVLYLLFPISLLWTRRRRFPRELNLDSLG